MLLHDVSLQSERIERGSNIMIETTRKKSSIRTKLQILEGWIERVDLSNRRLHVRTGSRDKFGVCVLVPDQCDIRHQLYHLQLSSLLPCDAISVSYQQDENGARIAHTVEMITG